VRGMKSRVAVTVVVVVVVGAVVVSAASDSLHDVGAISGQPGDDRKRGR
jgi:hypothetical protein